MTAIIYRGKKSTREIWAYIRRNSLTNDLKKHSGKNIKDVRRVHLIAFLEHLEEKQKANQS